jgi:CheY-like chemotaxis protein
MAHVLVVDDDGPTRAMLCDVLGDEGYEVSEAADGAAGLAALRAMSQPCVVLVDLVMPPPDGVEFLRTVALDPALASRHRYVAMTAGDPIDMGLPDEVRRLLPVPVLAKPFELDDLLALVAGAAHRL